MAQQEDSMFDILQADVVVMQELKIQRKDLNDDMVLIPGWDCFFSLPKAKKGYSGVAIYTRQAKCAPIRAEEGITGELCPPGSSSSYRHLPADQTIGGYPTEDQLAESAVDAAALDSEGRCVALEFPAFVLLGLYCPANRDETRDDFRLGFLHVLDSRIRNLVALGKRVIVAGDLNIIRSELDSANAEEQLRKRGLSGDDYLATPARRLLNQLVLDGRVAGARDKDREEAVMWDVCRNFHRSRLGMFTCWEQRINARPGNFGARIDYILCDATMDKWFADSNIQEGLMGSDHCPVFAIIKDQVLANGKESYLMDLLNPPGTFSDGKRLIKQTAVRLLPTSGRLIPEFGRRRNIRDMFSKHPPGTPPQEHEVIDQGPNIAQSQHRPHSQSRSDTNTDSIHDKSLVLHTDTSPSTSKKRSAPRPLSSGSSKKSKSAALKSREGSQQKGQQSLKSFFNSTSIDASRQPNDKSDSYSRNPQSAFSEATPDSKPLGSVPLLPLPLTNVTAERAEDGSAESPSPGTEIHDSIEAKESWFKLLHGKQRQPNCGSHDEPCIRFVTKKAGVNCGRPFYICPRPLGPNGEKENGTQWRCRTFIWASDWGGKPSDKAGL
ncbi:MAG: Class II abasic (AP) endonuclease [Vezdaea aestivalis]|nr:MAG: Class II abasic (AP) endonuclease [Vezdaea aestivalis]